MGALLSTDKMVVDCKDKLARSLYRIDIRIMGEEEKYKVLEERGMRVTSKASARVIAEEMVHRRLTIDALRNSEATLKRMQYNLDTLGMHKEVTNFMEEVNTIMQWENMRGDDTSTLIEYTKEASKMERKADRMNVLVSGSGKSNVTEVDAIMDKMSEARTLDLGLSDTPLHTIPDVVSIKLN